LLLAVAHSYADAFGDVAGASKATAGEQHYGVVRTHPTSEERMSTSRRNAALRLRIPTQALFAAILGLGIAACTQTTGGGAPVDQDAAVSGVIYAAPGNVASLIPYERILGISEYFKQPENSVGIQFPSPETQYAWQNMSRYFPTAQVMRADPIMPLPYRINQAIGDVEFTDVKGGTQTVNSHFEDFPIDALVVVQRGEIVYERYKTMRPTDKHIWFSVSKVIGSTLMGLLAEEGKVDLNLPVTHYLPELADSVWDSVRVVEAMDMSTGLDGTEHDEPTHDERTNPQQIWFQ
jgi:Beta-lactamase